LLWAGNATQGFAGPALLGHVPVAKYCEPPSTLQAQPESSPGMASRVDHSTLANWVGGACWWLGASAAKACRVHDRFAKAVRRRRPDCRCSIPDRGAHQAGRLWVYARDDRPWSGTDSRPRSISTAPFVGWSVLSPIWRSSRASFKSTAMPGFGPAA
jgi:hypothetical protein